MSLYSNMAGQRFTLPDRPMEPPEDVMCFRCDFCRGEIYVGDFYYSIEGKVICPDCLGRFAKRYFSDRVRRAR